MRTQIESKRQTKPFQGKINKLEARAWLTMGMTVTTIVVAHLWLLSMVAGK